MSPGHTSMIHRHISSMMGYQRVGCSLTEGIGIRCGVPWSPRYLLMEFVLVWMALIPL